MKKTIAAAMALAAMCACGNPGSGSGQAANAEASENDSAALEQPATGGQGFKKPENDIALEIWNKFYKDKYQAGKDNPNITSQDSRSISNVIYNFADVEYVEYDDGAMVNIFRRIEIACYQHSGGYWHVVELSTEFCSDGCDEIYSIRHFRYEGGKLTEIENTSGLYSGLDSKPENITSPECCPTYFIINFGLEMAETKAFNWDGEKFVVDNPTIAQHISEKDLFMMVASENPLLKGKKLDIDFNPDYAGWQNFQDGGCWFSYGRYKLDSGGFAIYLSAKKESQDAAVYKYTFIDGKLNFVSDNEFIKETGDSGALAKFIMFTSNPYFQGLAIGSDSYSWNGNTWVKDKPTQAETPQDQGLEGAGGWTFQKPAEDIATAVFNICDKGASMEKGWKQSKWDFSTMDSQSEQNVLYHYSASVHVQYTQEEMEEVDASMAYMNDDGTEDNCCCTEIGCYKNDGGYWTVVVYHSVNVNERKTYPDMHCYKYISGQLETDEAPLMTPELQAMLGDGNLAPYYYYGVDFKPAALRLPGSDKTLLLKWDGKKFVPEAAEPEY